MSTTLEVMAMHGWASDARCWEPWRTVTGPLGWRWETGERGYGEFTPKVPAWDVKAPPAARRMVIGHSLGPHLLAPEVLSRADVVVFLTSFAAFVPPGRAGRRSRAALAGMAAALAEEAPARAMLTNFLVNAAAPQPADLLPPGPVDGPLNAMNRERLREGLEILERCTGLPEGFPSKAQVLIVEAEEDRIVEAEARALLRAALPQADVITLPGVGHALLAGDVIGRVVAWVESWRGWKD